MTRRKINLESSADTEDAVVGLLGRKTLDGSLDGVVLFGDQVVEPDAVSRRCSIHVQRSDMSGQAETRQNEETNGRPPYRM